MNRLLLSSLVIAGLWTLTPSCSAPEPGTHTARDADDPAAPAPTTASAVSGEKQEIPASDRLRSLDKTVYKVTVDDLPAIGAASAPLTVVLFSDYECKFCNMVEPQIAQLRADHGSDVRIVLAPTPLPFHVNAKPAALAAIAAAEQGKLEPMHRALIALDGKLDDASLTKAARDAGLDLARFDADRRGAKAEKTLARASEIAKRFSVSSTPTTFVNGRRITGAVPHVIHDLGEEQLAVGRNLVKAGTPASRVYETVIAEGLDHAEADPSIVNIFKGGESKAQKMPFLDDLRREISKCWAATGVTPAKPARVELSVGPDGKVRHATTEAANLEACATKVASAWTFKKNSGDSSMKFVIDDVQ